MTIDVFADLACPWCSIGEAYLDAALAVRPGLHVERRWRPFQLQPGLPPEGVPLRPFFPDKFGGEAAMATAFARVAEAGARAGVPFAFERMTGVPNTSDAHRLVLLAQTLGQTWTTARSLYDGYFAEGANLGDPETLVTLAARGGLPEADARALLAGDRFAADVQASQMLAARLGVAGVPFVVVDGRVGISGAQPADAIGVVLDRVAAERDGAGA